MVARLMNAALALVLLGATPAAQAKEAATRTLPFVRPSRQIVLDARTIADAVPIRVARNLLTIVEFPEDMLETPTCPDCNDGTEPDGDALFRLKSEAQGRYLVITPNKNEGRRMRPGEDAVTTVMVRLEHAILMLYLQRVERKTAADTRVTLVYPNRAAESEYVRVEKAKLEAETAAKIEEGAAKRFLRAFREPHRCERKSARARYEDVVLEVSEICSFDRQVVIAFSVENRGRSPFVIGTVAVNKGVKKDGDVSESTVEFQHVSTGVAVVMLRKEENARGPYDVTVSEAQGKSRVVTVRGLEL